MCHWVSQCGTKQPKAQQGQGTHCLRTPLQVALTNKQLTKILFQKIFWQLLRDLISGCMYSRCRLQQKAYQCINDCEE